MSTVATPKPMTPNGCGGARSTTDFRFSEVGDVLVAPFALPEDAVSGRVDLVLSGEVGARARVRMTTSEAFPTTDDGLPGIIVVEGAYTLVSRNDRVAIGAGPCWVARWISLRITVEALGPTGAPFTGTAEVNVANVPSAPFRTLGIGVVP